jgi:alkanesulfonate monooxygenase SsuD/methylene tetrahydromethanopterin reductase-like flavin-dependent oxidoreductase (luciferase family)
MTGCLVSSSQTDFRARATRIHETIGSGDLDTWIDELRGTWIIGGPEQAADHLGRHADVGVTGVLLQHHAPDALDMLDTMMADLAPRL